MCRFTMINYSTVALERAAKERPRTTGIYIVIPATAYVHVHVHVHVEAAMCTYFYKLLRLRHVDIFLSLRGCC